MDITISRPTIVRVRRPDREVVHFVKEWRKHKGLSVEKLGEIAGVSGSMISQLERGKTTYTQRTLEALATAMNVQPWQLLACGPDENQELWRTVMERVDHRAALKEIDESDRPAFEEMVEEMLKNNCEAAVKSAQRLFPKRVREEAKPG